MSDDEFAELQRMVDHADLLHAELNAMSESEVVRTYDTNGLVIEERFPADYSARIKALADQLRAEREAIFDYAREHGWDSPSGLPT